MGKSISQDQHVIDPSVSRGKNMLQGKKNYCDQSNFFFFFDKLTTDNTNKYFTPIL